MDNNEEGIFVRSSFRPSGLNHELNIINKFNNQKRKHVDVESGEPQVIGRKQNKVDFGGEDPLLKKAVCENDETPGKYKQGLNGLEDTLSIKADCEDKDMSMSKAVNTNYEPFNLKTKKTVTVLDVPPKRSVPPTESEDNVINGVKRRHDLPKGHSAVQASHVVNTSTSAKNNQVMKMTKAFNAGAITEGETGLNLKEPDIDKEMINDLFSRSYHQSIQHYEFTNSLACGPVTDRHCKVKAYFKAIKLDPKGKESVNKDEVQIPFGLSHPGIVAMLGIFCTPHIYIIVMEDCGPTLKTSIYKDEQFKTFLMSPDNFTTVFTGLYQAVSFLERHSIAHRDLKPENLTVMRCLETYRIKIIDFGSAQTSQSLPGFRGHTWEYLPPGLNKIMKQAQMSLYRLNNEFFDENCDCYSVSIVVLWADNGGRHPIAKVNEYTAQGLRQQRQIVMEEIINLPKNYFDPFLQTLSVPALREPLRNSLNSNPKERWSATDVCTFLESPHHSLRHMPGPSTGLIIKPNVKQNERSDNKDCRTAGDARPKVVGMKAGANCVTPRSGFSGRNDPFGINYHKPAMGSLLLQLQPKTGQRQSTEPETVYRGLGCTPQQSNNSVMGIRTWQSGNHGQNCSGSSFLHQNQGFGKSFVQPQHVQLNGRECQLPTALQGCQSPMCVLKNAGASSNQGLGLHYKVKMATDNQTPGPSSAADFRPSLIVERQRESLDHDQSLGFSPASSSPMAVDSQAKAMDVIVPHFEMLLGDKESEMAIVKRKGKAKGGKTAAKKTSG